jgi:hypothetical protein
MSARLDRRAFVSSVAAVAASSIMTTSAGADATPQASPDPSVTNSPAGLQLQWVIGVINGDVPMPDETEIAAHFSSDFLAQVPATQVIALFQQLQQQAAPITIDRVAGIPVDLAIDVLASDRSGQQLVISIVVEEAEPHVISGLVFQPSSAGATPTVTPLASWNDLESALSEAGPDYAVYAAEVLADGSIQDIHQVAANPMLAIGSAFKLYVLGALATTIESGKIGWDSTVEVTEATKSLPSGVTQNELSGKQLTTLELATRMISISDNTATDMLIQYLGRPACEDQLTTLGNSAPERTIPMLKTREMFTLKLGNHQELVAKYIAGDVATKRRVLEEIAGNPLPDLAAVAAWTTPILIDEIEWFAAMPDLAHAINELWSLGGHPGLTQVRDVLTRNPGIPVDTGVWSNAAFKGGSEPGVLALVWRLERADGRVFLFSCGVNNGSAVIDEMAVINAAAGAFALLESV